MYTNDAPAAYWRDQLFLWGPRVLIAILILWPFYSVPTGSRGVVTQFGGQTPLRLARHIEAGGYRILGTPHAAIDLAEDRGSLAPESAARMRATGSTAGEGSLGWCSDGSAPSPLRQHPWL